jgi:spoIIIJ-associated protein
MTVGVGVHKYMDEKIKTAIQTTVEQLLEKMGFDAKVAVSQSGDDDSIVCDITADTDSNFLIGQYGANLQAVQHLARLIVRKNVPEKIRFILDVNSYRQQKNQTVIQQALAAAEEALREHRAVALKPMSTYERRIVHLELSKNTQISTESVGEGEDRKIVVKPADAV